ncbi:methyltransferase [Pseudonocardia sp. HH130630-07]|uniref:methyltransferase n=1 Tax=Pseudonocardia sp. HH130630-07 TaxID=1690815 RepID=UPI000815006F|nr:methyltransferase [Pseudonocardia sp. HH130630-07]ANY09593.1 hypothetical protein AFB00_28910 [Pseudonocardia sp. HH130630-07]
MITGYMPALVVAAALRLDLPATIAAETVTVEDLATRTTYRPDPLRRLLRALAALGLASEVRPDTFELTARGRRLQPGVDGSLYPLAAVMLHETMWRGWPVLDEAVRTGGTAFEQVYGTVDWQVGSEYRELVDRSMLDETRSVAAAVVAAYDFTPFTCVTDIGGGSGPLLAAVASAHPHLRGVVYDLADGLRHADGVLAAATVDDRCRTEVGDFFARIPPADLHLCKSVVFNWPDDSDVSAILANSRRALSSGGRLLLVEQMLPDVVDGSLPARLYVDDVNSIVSLGGRLRTESEYRSLLERAGFALRVRPLPDAPGSYSLLEAVPQ